MPRTNKHGLSRYIPEEIKREVRRACGFGCVMCGCGLYQYEHISPLYVDATTHDPNGMALLCGTCHDHVTRGRWSKQRVAAARESPKARDLGFSFAELDIGTDSPIVQIGGTTWRDCAVILQADAVPLLSIKSPEEPGTPFRLSAKLFNSTGELLLEIVDNELRQFSTAWDIETVGPSLRVRNEPRDIALELRSVPGRGVSIEKLQMYSPSGRILADANGLSVVKSNGSTLHLPSKGVEGVGCGIGILVTQHTIGLALHGGRVALPDLHVDNIDVAFIVRMNQLAKTYGFPLPGRFEHQKFHLEYDFDLSVGRVLLPSTGELIHELPVSSEKLETVPTGRFEILFNCLVCTLPDGSEVSLFEPTGTGYRTGRSFP